MCHSMPCSSRLSWQWEVELRVSHMLSTFDIHRWDIVEIVCEVEGSYVLAAPRGVETSSITEDMPRTLRSEKPAGAKCPTVDPNM